MLLPSAVLYPLQCYRANRQHSGQNQGLFVFISWYPDCEKKYKVRFFIVLDLEGMHSMGYCMHPRVQFKVVALNAWPPVNEIRDLVFGCVCRSTLLPDECKLMTDRIFVSLKIPSCRCHFFLGKPRSIHLRILLILG